MNRFTTQVIVQVEAVRARTLGTYFQDMELNLEAHDEDRGPVSWRDDAPEDLFRHLEEEVAELKELIFKKRGDSEENTAGTLMSIRREAADIGNMAAMVADAAGALPR